MADFKGPSFNEELAAGVRFSQKSEWFTCPPPLNFKALCKAIIPDTSDADTAESSFSKLTFKFVTYVL